MGEPVFLHHRYQLSWSLLVIAFCAWSHGDHSMRGSALISCSQAGFYTECRGGEPVSTVIMSQCWPIQGISATQKAVLISLADNANDDGVCWPSIASISERTCLSERAVRSSLRKLEELGLLVSHQRSG